MLRAVMMSSKGKCEQCSIESISLNYLVTPQKEGKPIHSRLCPQCTAKHVDLFLAQDNKEPIKVNCWVAHVPWCTRSNRSRQRVHEATPAKSTLRRISVVDTLERLELTRCVMRMCARHIEAGKSGNLSHLPTVERVKQRLCPRFFIWGLYA